MRNNGNLVTDANVNVCFGRVSDPLLGQNLSAHVIGYGGFGSFNNWNNPYGFGGFGGFGSFNSWNDPYGYDGFGYSNSAFGCMNNLSLYGTSCLYASILKKGYDNQYYCTNGVNAVVEADNEEEADKYCDALKSYIENDSLLIAIQEGAVEFSESYKIEYISFAKFKEITGLDSFEYIELNDYMTSINGNLFGVYEPQDNLCSMFGLGYIADNIPSILDKCIKHDQCMNEYLCNSSSWLTTPFKDSVCGACNLDFFKD
ncbi:hypothetical protein LP316_10395 [Thalassotalea sp. LPB0316]|uniref:hypothetical protein n=1 Tax=Thalassotalea sp. LPB0316 TaxID=2769490 RepID=UPI001869584C|nr:hypothetical protein [Thalassotalea sp. LPB0316]QOL24739.1 hypothetical protein LP316_10395 [Thalassotalea sp. LPB0316]